ncbi:hypothetical protein, partial [Salmonella enterica]|uniref:hypothetical protein n=1 Tax=Salmonella enterica TaxID=28901 RepID=UPI0015903DEE
DPDHALMYNFFVPKSAEITGGQGASSTTSHWQVSLDNTHPLTIKPDSDSYIIPSQIILTEDSRANITNLGTTVSGGFDYTFTYQ